ncbi:YfiR family protein [Inhella sp.]|uniref:YfiR family protein n=1 Tax=Inhella sp. TaxID=1921806 RepID=UPI0035AF86B8
MPLRRLAPVALLMAWACAQAWAQQPAEVLKAQVLVKVLRFVEWPAGALPPGQPMQVCLAVDSPLAQELGRSAGLDVQGRMLRTRQVPQGVRLPEGCHVGLVGSSAPPDVAPGVLVVSEEVGALDRGAMLALLVEDGRVAFDVELEAARRGGVGFSARLLRLARFVRKD